MKKLKWMKLSMCVYLFCGCIVVLFIIVVLMLEVCFIFYMLVENKWVLLNINYSCRLLECIYVVFYVMICWWVYIVVIVVVVCYCVSYDLVVLIFDWFLKNFKSRFNLFNLCFGIFGWLNMLKDGLYFEMEEK